MDASTWNTIFGAVQDMIVSLLGFMFTAFGVASSVLLALIFLNALFRLIIIPLVGHNPIFNGLSSLSDRIEQRKAEKAQKK